MPAYDGTGPLGSGPGAGLGLCGFSGYGGRRFGGSGFGCRYGLSASRLPSRKEMVLKLADYKQWLQEELHAVEREEKDLDSKTQPKP